MQLIFFIHVSNMKRKFNERNSIGHMVPCLKLLTAMCLGKRSNVCILRVSLKKQNKQEVAALVTCPTALRKAKEGRICSGSQLKSSLSCHRSLWYPIASLHLQPGSREMNAPLTAPLLLMQSEVPAYVMTPWCGIFAHCVDMCCWDFVSNSAKRR